jgi:hypothetical protein
MSRSSTVATSKATSEEMRLFIGIAGVGLYGVLDYSVLQRRREIGIRIAIGAHAGEILRLVTADVFSMVPCAGPL